MDRRTLLYILSLSFVLFFVNMYFQQQNDETVRVWQQQQTAKKLAFDTEKIQEIKERTANISALPNATIVDAKNNPVALAYTQGELLLSAPENTFPKDVLVNKKPLTLLNTNTNGSPLLFTSEKTGSLKVAELPSRGQYDLQILYSATATDPKVILAEWIDGRLVFPQDLVSPKALQEADLALPKNGYAIALYKHSEGYLPFGIVNFENKNLVLLGNFNSFPITLFPYTSGPKATPSPQDEKYYVIETPYQQLVFSNVGAALAEVNLPFETASNKKSAVREIEFDREMVQDHPYNAHFPAHPYYIVSDGKQTFTEQGKLGGYYPLIRRDLIEVGQRKSVNIPPQYYALNIVSEYPELAELRYEVKEFTDTKIVFEAVKGYRKVTKTYSVEKNNTVAPYCVHLTINIEGDSRGLWITTGVPEVEWISGAVAPALKYRISRNNKPIVESIDLPKDVITFSSISPDWICNSNGFFGIIVDPLSQIDSGIRASFVSGTSVPTRLLEIGEDVEKFKAQDLPGYAMMLPLKANGGTMDFRIYAGPFADESLNAVDAAFSNPETGYNPDYIACQSFHGWFSFISEPFANFLFVLMNLFHTWTGSWAFSIVLLTVALRIMLYPLNAWSTKSMLNMQQIAPQVATIQEKYKKEPQKGQMEIMNLYREKGINPLSGCLPLLIQMPFLIGMFDLLKSAFELRGASFIPGWIDNLTSPDVLFSWHTPIFFIGNQFHLLPVLLGLVMFFQQHMMSSLPKDSRLWTDQQRQQRAMGNVMAVVFAFMFYNFPSGLNIYWLSSMLLGMLQQWWMQRKFKAATAAILEKENQKKSVTISSKKQK